MLRKIEVTHNIIPVDGVLYKRADVEVLYSISKIKKNTERNAQKIIARARDEAVEIKTLAFSQGYHDGMVAVIDELVDYIKLTDNVILDIRKKIYSEVREYLLSVLTRTDVIIACLSEWINSFENNELTLSIIIPDSYESRESEIINQLSKVWAGELNVSYHENKQISLLCGPHIAEFNPPDFVNNLLEIISDKYSLIIHESLAEIADAKTTDILKQR